MNTEELHQRFVELHRQQQDLETELASLLAVEVATAQSMNTLICQHCGWTWTPRKKNGLPARCPECAQADWNRPHLLNRNRAAWTCRRRSISQWKQEEEQYHLPATPKRAYRADM